MFKSGHNQCKKKQIGTYKLDLESFIRAYTRQMKEEYEAKGADYDVDEDAMAYLECQQYYYNNNLVSDTELNGMEWNKTKYHSECGCIFFLLYFQIHLLTYFLTNLIHTISYILSTITPYYVIII